MEQTYKIEWSEKKTTSTGKEKIDASLRGADGIMHDKVTIWGDYPNFASLMTGHEVVGTLMPAKDPKYGPTLYAPKAGKAGYSGPARSPSAITKAMKDKADGIEKTMDRKEDGIKISATMRDATLLAVSEYTEQRRISANGPTLEQLHKKWREYLWTNWECSDTDFPPKM